MKYVSHMKTIVNVPENTNNIITFTYTFDFNRKEKDSGKFYDTLCICASSLADLCRCEAEMEREDDQYHVTLNAYMNPAFLIYEDLIRQAHARIHAFLEPWM